MRNKIFIIAIILLSIGCKKDDIKDENINSNVELGIPLNDLEQIEKYGVDTTIELEDLQFDDGTSVLKWLQEHDNIFFQQYLKTTQPLQYDLLENKLQSLIARTTAAAYILVEKEVPNQKNGIAYVWNSKNHEVLSHCENTSSQVDCKCLDNLYGLDCSGFIYQIFNTYVGLDIGKSGTEYYSNVDNWNEAFDKSEIFKGLKAFDEQKLNENELKVGDIIVKANRHMGVIIRSDDGTLKLANSLGSWKKNCSDNTSSRYGPIFIPSPDYRTIQDFLDKVFGGDYKVIRFKNPNTYYSGENINSPLIFFPTLNGSPSYSGHMAISAAHIALELTKDNSELIHIEGNINISSPDIANFHEVQKNVPIVVNSLFNNTNGEINIVEGNIEIKGKLIDNEIRGKLFLNTTYTDDFSQKVTPTQLYCDITLYAGK